MRRCPTRGDRSRAVIAVIALYALCLQALLAGLAPGVPAAPTIAGDGVICAHSGDAPGGDRAACPDHACCLAVPAAHALAPRAEAGSAASWLDRAAAPILWRAADGHPARAPPGLSARPRGPPAV